MKSLDLTNIYSLSLKIMTILKEEYKVYLSEDKLKFLNNLDVFKFYKNVDEKNMPLFYYFGNKYYINCNIDINYFEQLVPFLCLSSLCSNLNPLKIGLIEEELLYLKDKYQLNIKTNFKKELEVSSIVSQSILKDVPFKVIFKETDSDIVNYLIEECGGKIGMCYLDVSKKMKMIRKNNYYLFENDDVDYSEVLDFLYSFISNKTKYI